jgi:hypothetical protein
MDLEEWLVAPVEELLLRQRHPRADVEEIDRQVAGRRIATEPFLDLEHGFVDSVLHDAHFPVGLHPSIAELLRLVIELMHPQFELFRGLTDLREMREDRDVFGYMGKDGPAQS